MKKITTVLIALFCLGIGIGRAQYKVLLNFNSRNGDSPFGDLTLLGNELYGMANQGGLYGSGCIFRIDTNGTADTNNLHDFGGVADPRGSLTYSPSGVLYGMTVVGYPYGSIFSIDTNGSRYRTIHIFNDTNGANPTGNVLLSGKKLYGMTCYGGMHDSGCIFSLDTDGSRYKDLHDFSSLTGSSPFSGSLILIKGKLYGMASAGGAHNVGAIFSIDTNGNNYKDIFDFSISTGDYPTGSLLYSAGLLYGMSESGGANGDGTVFSIDTNGSNYKDLLDFSGANGADPYGSLTLSGDTLYGMTFMGGVNGSGCIFSIKTNGSKYKDLFNFGINGMEPQGSLAFSRGMLYGMTSQGGTNFDGVVFSFNLNGWSNNYNQPICIATLDTANNKNKIIWGRTNSPPASGYGYYNIYKDTGRGYVLLNSQPLDSLSEYIDTSNTWGPVSYQLSTVDSCGESALSATHTTIFLTSTASLNAFNLSWTPYVGFVPTEYRIFRGPGLNALKQIDSVANNVLTYTDSFPPLGSYYAIEAVSPNGVCIPTTHRPYNRLSASLSGSFSNGFNTATLGINNINATSSRLNIYPNPSNGMITLNYSLNGAGNVRTTILNELGQVVYDNTEQKNAGNITKQLSLENLASGIYTLRLQTDNSIMVRKVVLMGNK